MRIILRAAAAAILLTITVTATAPTTLGQAGARAGRGPAPDLSVPRDLRPLLAPRRSEMAIVAARYGADRGALISNYAGGGRGGGGGGGGRGGGRGGRGAAQADTVALPAITISAERIARLKRFDTSWLSAVGGINPERLSAPARAGRDSLLTAIRGNLTALDEEAAARAQVLPLLPFLEPLVGIVEKRIKVQPFDAQVDAGVVNSVTKEIRALRAQLTAGLTNSGGVRATRAQALAAASAIQSLRGGLDYWFSFYDGYDPVFSWWMRVPFAHLDSTLTNYGTFLRNVVAPANLASTLTPSSPNIHAALPSRYSEVPDLNELLALPQDEMAEIVQRFRAVQGGGRGGGGRGQGGGGAAPVRDSAFFNGWLAALNTLNFDRLSRNAQVDYLFIKKRAELERSRLGRPLPETNPRKTDDSGIPGPARGREGLIRDLEDELIPYTPEQLIVLAEREFAWHEEEMKKASRELGFGDDWKAAVEKTKTMTVPPGEQPRMIRDLVYEAIEYLRDRDLITMPEIAAEVQHMTMMSPERQLTSPFFLGGSQIIVSYPTDAMEYEARLQSMRGNNRPWSHATAQHEMIPGHNLTGYYGQRFGNYRPSLGGGPFFSEGWAVYWELTLWDKGFHDTPEERIGALVWRMHRCARIIFSLNFHMGRWSPQEAVDFLVDRVGHERDNATAEVRRSFEGSYGPLYQAAYLLGAIQLRGLRRELVDRGRMTEKAFHDEILRQGSMPIALLKLALPGERLTRGMRIDNWQFYGALPER